MDYEVTTKIDITRIFQVLYYGLHLGRDVSLYEMIPKNRGDEIRMIQHLQKTQLNIFKKTFFGMLEKLQTMSQNAGCGYLNKANLHDQLGSLVEDEHSGFYSYREIHRIPEIAIYLINCDTLKWNTIMLKTLNSLYHHHPSIQDLIAKQIEINEENLN